jgi:hypothetical protein
MKVLVARTEQSFDIGTKFDVFLHQVFEFTSGVCAPMNMPETLLLFDSLVGT